MLEDIIQHDAQGLEACFDESEVEQMARDCKFVQRASKLTGIIFIKALVLGFIQHPKATLSQLCQACLDFGVKISSQGLDQRITQEAVTLVKKMLQRSLTVLRAKRQEIAEVLDQFTAVYFQDSTIISLPEALRDVFPGAGGNASCAAVKIQLLFEFLEGSIAHLSFVAGRQPDQGYQGHLPKVRPGSLLIQDLGFFSLKTLKDVALHMAFFLTRWKQDTRVYLAQDPHQPLDMFAFLCQQQVEAAEYNVLLGAKTRIPCRMVCVHLPPTVASQRRRRAKVDAQRRGNTPSKRSLALLDWNVFLTNVPPERLSLRQILLCYSLRWQVELIFKLWKSEAALKHLAGIRKERVLCELYAKMTGIVLTHFLVAPLRFVLREQQVEISPTKARQIFQDRAKLLAVAIGVGAQRLKDEIRDLCERILYFARKTKRKKHLSTYCKLLVVHDLAIYQLYPLT